MTPDGERANSPEREIMWEYCQVYFHSKERGIIAVKGDETITSGGNLVNVMNELGEFGWELVTATTDKFGLSIFYMKRNVYKP